MKQLLLVLFLLPMVQDTQLDNITAAINSGDWQTLSNYMDQTVEIALLEDGNMYLKKEAVSKLKTFFEKNQGASFEAVHKGFSGGKSSLYCIGDLKTKQSTYRVFLYMRVQDGQYYIQEMRFEENN